MDENDLEDLEEDYLRKTKKYEENDEKMRVSGRGVFVVQDQLNKNKERKIKKEAQ